jgi:hypothetical protein
LSNKAVTPEVMKKHSAVTPAERLTALPELINEAFKIFDQIRYHYAAQGLKIGLLLLEAKKLIPHGEFEEWKEKNILKARTRHCQYLQKLAQRFIDEQGLTLDAAYQLPAHIDPDKPVFDFVGESSLNELLAKYHIKTIEPPKRQPFAPGPHDPWKEHPTTPEEMRAERESRSRDWNKILATLDLHCIKNQSYDILPKKDVELIAGTFTDALRIMREHLKHR